MMKNDDKCNINNSPASEDRIESNLSKTKNIPLKAVIFSDFVVPLPCH